MRIFAHFSAKNFRFFEIDGVSARSREEGIELVRHLADKGVNFSRFWANIFYGRPLTLHPQPERLNLNPLYSNLLPYMVRSVGLQYSRLFWNSFKLFYKNHFIRTRGSFWLKI